MMAQYTLLIEKGDDGYLIAEVAELPGCRTQAKTRKQLLERAREAISLYVEEKRPRRISVQRIDVEA